LRRINSFFPSGIKMMPTARFTGHPSTLFIALEKKLTNIQGVFTDPFSFSWEIVLIAIHTELTTD